MVDRDDRGGVGRGVGVGGGVDAHDDVGGEGGVGHQGCVVGIIVETMKTHS